MINEIDTLSDDAFRMSHSYVMMSADDACVRSIEEVITLFTESIGSEARWFERILEIRVDDLQR